MIECEERRDPTRSGRRAMDVDPRECPAHLNLVIQLTKIETIQAALVDTQKSVNSKLDDIKLSIGEMKTTAVRNQTSVTAEIAKDRIKIGPLYWSVAVAGTAFISGIVHWVGRLVFK